MAGRRRCSTMAAIAALVASLLVGVAGASAATVTRRAGDDRYTTAAAVSEASFQPGVDRAVVATGEAPFDALAGAALRSPILLAGRDGVPAATAGELDRLRPGEILVLGGPDAISDGAVADLQRHTTGPVRRLAGGDRYETAAAISAEGFAPGPPVAFVASGAAFADALAAGAAAAAIGGPVLLTAPGELPAVTATELQRLHPAAITVLGGAAAVADAVVARLDGYTDGPVGRLAGRDRYETAAGVARYAYPNGAPTAYVATGVAFPDALAGGPAAGVDRAPLLLVAPTCVPDAVRAELDALAPTTLVVLGGPGAVDPAVESIAACPPPPPPPPATPGGRVFALGDSVMLGAKTALEAIGNGWSVTVDAKVSRQFDDGIPIARSAAAAGADGLVVHLGTNGPVSAAQLDRMLEAARGVPRVVLLTIQLPNTSRYAYEASTNDVIRQGAARWGTGLADWNAATDGHPELLAGDGTHVTAAGARVYASLVAQAL